jgi:uncharacterized membrane protein/protein-disulfide isomerase
LLAIAASLLGLAVSWLLSLHHVGLGVGAHLCPDSAASGCSAVLSSKYAAPFGIPLAYAGVLFHTFALASSLAVLRGSAPWRRVALIWAWVGVLASAALVTLQLTLIRSTCPYCITSAIASLLLLFGVWLAGPRPRAARRGVATTLTSLVLLALSMGALASIATGGSGGGEDLLARFEDRDIRLADMIRDVPEVTESLARSSYEARAAYIRRKLGGLALEADARKLGLTGSQYIAREVDDYINRQELPRIEQTASELSPDDPARRDKIIQTMRSEARDARLEALVDQSLAHYRTQVFLKPPVGRAVSLDPALTDAVHREGPADAPLQLVVFSDLQCPICAHLDETLAALRMKFGDQLAITYRHFPLRNHDQAEPAAVLAECLADTRGAEGFQLLKRTLYARIRSGNDLTPDTLRQDAQSAGLSPDQIDACLSNPDLLARVRKSAQQARDLKFDGAPTLILNNHVLGDAQDEETLEKRLRQELQNQ